MIDERSRHIAFLRDLQEKRPFEDYQPQPDKNERKRLEMQRIPWALPYGEPFGRGHKFDCPCNYCRSKAHG